MKKATTASSGSSSSSPKSPKTTKTTKSPKGSKSKYMQIDEDQLRYAFQMIDNKKDGKVNASQMKQMLVSIGIDVPERLISKIIKEASQDDSGLIKEQDFLAWFSRFKTPKDDDVEADLKAAFMVFDTDGSGFIERSELKSAMKVIGETLSDRDIDELLQTTDSDNDGKINYEEFIKALL